MALFSFFSTPRHKKFEYNPMHYDPKKEELMERINAAKSRGSDDDNIDSIRKRIKGKMGKSGGGSPNKLISYRRKYKRKSNIRLFILILILVGLTFLILNSSDLLSFLELINE